MNLIYILEQDSKFYNIFSRALDDNTNIQTFSGIKGLSVALEENEPDLLMISDEYVSDKDLPDILSFTQSMLVDNVLLSMDEPQKVFPQYFDSYLGFVDSTEHIRMTLDRHLRKRERVKSLHQSIAESNALTEKSLTLAGDLGEIQKIYYGLNEIKNIDDLIGAILNIIDHYQIKVTLMITFSGENLFYTNTDRLSELDTDVIKEKRSEQRFVEFGVRTQINYDSISVLVKNMPKKSTEKYICIKDNIVNLLRACDSLIKLYEFFQMQEKIGFKISQSSNVIKEMVEQAYESQISIMNKAIQDIEDKFYTFGLLESQEKEVLDILRRIEADTEHLIFLTKGIVNILAELQNDALDMLKLK
ncbi:MAG: hypothetical protein HQL46_16205 [Gammaproteobacteria bacterium]|nr:hypothetical protein [Gammaproteobacteria bacterium]